MAKVKIQGHASGTGILTVTAPNTSTDRTITLPDATGTLLNTDGSAANLTAIPAANITGTLPAIDGSSLTGKNANRPNLKPLIVNGDCQVAQRGTSFSHANSGGNNWTVDRFNFNTGSIGVYTSTQESLTSGAAFEAGFKKAARIDCTTADASPANSDYFYVEYRMEAQDCLPFKKGTSNAETMTVAFWVKSNKTGTAQLNVRDHDNNRMCCGTYTISSANTWEQKVINIAADTSGAFNNDNGVGYAFEWFLGSGSDNTTGAAPTAWETRADGDRNANNLAINDNTANDWAITGIQVEVGTYTSATLPPFQFERYGDNLVRCQRYYQTHYCGIRGAKGNGTAMIGFGVDLPVGMRAAATCSITGTCSTYANDSVVQSNGTINSMQVSDFEADQSGTYLNFNLSGSSITDNRGYVIQSTADIKMDAEL